MRVLAWGELLWDLFPDGPRLGGAAANVAYHAARLGAEVRLVSRIGRDELGRKALELLGRTGVDTRYVSLDDERATGTVRVEFSRDGEPCFTIGQQVAWDHIGWSPELAAEICRMDVLVFGTLAQRTPLGAGALGRALAACAPSVWRVCDLNLRPPFVTRDLVDSSLRQADAVKLNELEASRLATLFGTTDPVTWLLEERAVRLVALTRGACGSLLATREERCDHPGFPRTGTDGDAVGAGDAFAAALATLLPRTSSLEVISRVANYYAAFVASSAGAMPPVPAAILEELAQLIVED